ncbi:MAG TPA: hydroxyacid dehydrogenase [bacterium]|nr:hydroxyacid dehydrogenase [bacterium]
MARIVLLNSMLHRVGEDLLAARAQVEIVPAAAAPDRLRSALRDADAVLVRLPARITREVIAAASRLRVIGTAGAGFDNIDVAAATAAGIPVVNNAGVGPNPVAEHTVGLMIALARRIVAGDRRLRRDGWACRERLLGAELGTELSGKTVGIVGFGFIGRRVAGICTAAFGSRVLAYDPFLEDAAFAAAGVERRGDLDALLPEVDFLTVHTPLSEETRHVIGARELALLRPTAYLINCARGGVVDADALADALRAGRLAGAGIDVFDPEPPAHPHPLYALENVIVTPHIAGLSDETNRRLSVSAAEQVLQVLADERPPRLVNPEVWSRRRRG